MNTARAGRGGFTRLTAVPYDTYLQLRDAPGNDNLRMAYHDGVLEIMSPERRHDRPSRRLLLLIVAYCEAFHVRYDVGGGATVRKRGPGAKKGQGKEPDESFYLRDAALLVEDKDTLDLGIDPPPSLWIEVDNRGSSRSKLPLYAGLGVPEVWRYRPRTRALWFGRLAGSGYEEIAASEALPGLNPATVLDLLDEPVYTAGGSWNSWLRDVWFPAHRGELIDGGAGH